MNPFHPMDVVAFKYDDNLDLYLIYEIREEDVLLRYNGVFSWVAAKHFLLITSIFQDGV